MAARFQSEVPEPGTILVRGVNWLGDAVMTTPALRRLREKFPRAKITLLTHEKLSELWNKHTDIDTVMTFMPGESPWTVSRRLRACQFDCALIFPNSVRSALEVWLAGIPNRIGYAGAWRRLLLTRSLNPPAHKLRKRSVAEVKRLIRFTSEKLGHPIQNSETHQLYDYLALAAALGCEPSPVEPRLFIGDDELKPALASLRQFAGAKDIAASGQSAIWLGLNISAAYGPAKRWPMERFAAVAREISSEIPAAVWLAFGGETDWELNETLAKQAAVPIANLAGKTSLRQLMVLLKSCRLLLTNDSGPMHVAAALGVPVIAPFGSTSPELTGPGLPGDSRHQVLRCQVSCSPCFLRTCPIDFRCMTGIQIEDVVRAVHKSLK